MAKRGVLNFASFVGRSSSFFATYPKLIWGYLPSIEVQARQYSSYVCSKVIPNPVSFSGNPGENGKPRVLGLLSSADEDHPELKLLTGLVKSQIEACGGKFAPGEDVPPGGLRPGRLDHRAVRHRQHGPVQAEGHHHDHLARRPGDQAVAGGGAGRVPAGDHPGRRPAASRAATTPRSRTRACGTTPSSSPT